MDAAFEITLTLQMMYRCESMIEQMGLEEQMEFAALRIDMMRQIRMISSVTAMKLVEAIQTLPTPSQRKTALDRVANVLRARS